MGWRSGLAAIALCAGLLAPHPNTLAAPGSKPIPWSKVSIHMSLPDQPLEEFVRDVAVVMSHYTRTTGSEICGMLSQSDHQFSITLGTSGSQIGCLIRRQDIPPGFISLEQSMHSHPHEGEKMLRSADWHWISTDPRYAPTRFYLRSGPSRKDRSIGVGWLVENGRLFRFEGREIQEKGEIPSSQNYDVLQSTYLAKDHS